jgi:PLP dependent protein
LAAARAYTKALPRQSLVKPARSPVDKAIAMPIDLHADTSAQASLNGNGTVPVPDGQTAVLAGAFAAIRQRMQAAALAAGRPADAARLIAVSKTHPRAQVEAALALGQRLFGENRVQEAKAKFAALKAAWPDLELHLIGPLQTNKVRDAVALFDVIHSLDRRKLAACLAEEGRRQNRLPRLLIEVNLSGEAQKAGVVPDELSALLATCRHDYGLRPEGLMCIPAVNADPASAFQTLATLAQAHHLPLLSMGMSGDFEQAIACGAHYVRVGSALFGARIPPPLAP